MKTSIKKVTTNIIVKNTVITGIVITSGIAAGLAVGIVLGKMLSTKAYAFNSPIDTGLEMDYDALMQRYNEDQNVDSYKPHAVANIAWL